MLGEERMEKKGVLGRKLGKKRWGKEGGGMRKARGREMRGGSRRARGDQVTFA